MYVFFILCQCRLIPLPLVTIFCCFADKPVLSAIIIQIRMMMQIFRHSLCILQHVCGVALHRESFRFHLVSHYINRWTSIHSSTEASVIVTSKNIWSYLLWVAICPNWVGPERPGSDWGPCNQNFRQIGECFRRTTISAVLHHHLYGKDKQKYLLIVKILDMW